MERGSEAVCRDRWENIKAIVELDLVEEKAGYIAELVEILESFYHAGIMPDDIVPEYERFRA